MLRESRTINVEPESELDHLLDEASKAPVIFARNGVRYRLSIEDDPWANYDPEAVRKAIRAMAGTITPKKESASRRRSIARGRKVRVPSIAHEVSRRQRLAD